MPVITALDIIQDSLELLGIYGPGDQISDADAERSRSVLSDMMDVWSNESLACFVWLTQTFTLIPNQYIYTVGPGGDIPGQRPLRVSDSPGAAYLLDQNLNRYIIEVVSQLDWNLKTTAVADSNLPNILFYNQIFPLGQIQVWPTPTTGYTCSFLSYSQLGDFASLLSPFSLPPGYKRAITTNLCLSLKPYFTGATLDPLIIKEASDTKRVVKVTNMRTQIARFDPELVSRGSSVYNIYTDRASGRF